jgi:Cysteine-rich secretory protein family
LKEATIMKTTIHLLTLSLTTLLTACGGGGGGGSTTTGGGTTVGTAIVTSVPTPTYTAGSNELAAFNYLNQERARCGFGMLAQNTQLDTAATAHANYLISNNTFGHSETVGLPGYTGISPATRSSAAGYGSWYVGEGISPGNTATGLEGIRWLLSAPYHLMGMVYGNIEVGMSYKTTVLSQAAQKILAVDMAISSTASKPQTPASGSVLTYPCATATNLPPSFSNEAENWAAATGVGSGGTPIVIVAPNYEVLANIVVTYTPTGGGAPITPSIIYSTNDPQHLLNSYQVLAIPSTTLASNTSYTVNITGTAGGIGFTKNFVMVTGT